MPDQEGDMIRRFLQICEDHTAFHKQVQALSAATSISIADIKTAIKENFVTIEDYSGFYYETSRLPTADECAMINDIGLFACIDLIDRLKGIVS